MLGHLQRGGSPSSYDRVLATRFGSFAVELLSAAKFGVMIALRSPDIVAVPLECVVGRTRTRADQRRRRPHRAERRDPFGD